VFRLASGKRKTKFFLFVLLAGIVYVAASRSLAADLIAPQQSITVAKTFDNRPFAYHVDRQSANRGFQVYNLTYPSPVVSSVPQNNTIPAEYYLPDVAGRGGPRRPAVIAMHILDGNMELVRMTCSVLASRGIPAILFKLPYYGERGLPGGPAVMATDPKLFTSAIAQAMEDVRRTIDLLASRPEIDPERIGITGISLGGIVAASAAENDPRLSRAMLVLAGGDLLAVIHYARETEDLSRLIKSLPAQRRTEVEAAIAAVDPLAHASQLRERARRGRVLMVNASDDRVIPRVCTEKLASALGITERVDWLDGLGHYTAMAALPRILDTMVDYFGQDLPTGVRVSPPPPLGRTPIAAVVSLIQQTVAMAGSEPTAAHCHFADIELSAMLADGKPIAGRLRFIRGSQWRFKLECKLPVVGEVSIGQGEHPWMASDGKKLFRGLTKPQTPRGDPLGFVDKNAMDRLRMIGGAAGALALAPNMLDSFVTIADDASADGHKSLLIRLKSRDTASIRLVLREDEITPESAAFNVDGIVGTLTFHQWQINTVAHDTMFEPPAGLPEQNVEPASLYHIFSAMLNFAVERLQ
jgi:hypothetical protein